MSEFHIERKVAEQIGEILEKAKWGEGLNFSEDPITSAQRVQTIQLAKGSRIAGAIVAALAFIFMALESRHPQVLDTSSLTSIPQGSERNFGLLSNQSEIIIPHITPLPKP
ncbi:hypothetical protein HY385_01690 [Candidatus Daviesbacteria bacterium]|nr:hypothetical protein [Candidatus Daviesbacteria bacterium]